MPSSRNPQQFPDDFLKQVLGRMNEGFDRIARERLMNREDSIKRHEEVVSLLRPLAGEQRQAVPVKLNKLERRIVKALGKDTLTGEKIAERIGRYNCNSNFKKTLSSMVKQGVLGNRHPGYFVIRQSQYQSQD